MMINREWSKLSRLFPVKVVPKVSSEAKLAASKEALPQVVVHPPKREKKRRAVFCVPFNGLIRPALSTSKTEWVPYCSFTLLNSRETVAKASSHGIGSNSPLPLSPTLFKGWVRRSGEYTTSF
jgi:hypothetical protein